jgi:hypothetical protein
MTRPHPAEIALAAVAVVSALALWSMGEWVRTNQEYGWSGEPTAEQLLRIAVSQLFWSLSPALAFAAPGSVLGLVFAWCFRPDRTDASSARTSLGQSSSATRTMSAAGSTENLTESTLPNSSPSISNSWGSPSTTSSTERPRE